MKALKEHLIEAIATIWLVIVGVEYLGRYFLGIQVPDLWRAYVGMLVLTTAVLACEACKFVRSRRNADRT